MAECVTIPEQPAVPAVPGTLALLPDFEWNAGANSETELDGNVRAAFTMGRVVGAVVGFVQTRDEPTDPDRLTHGFVFTSSGLLLRVQVVELGIVRTPLLPYTTGAEFELRRVEGVVQYLVAGVPVYLSSTPSTGELLVGASVFATDDEVGDVEFEPIAAARYAAQSSGALYLAGGAQQAIARGETELLLLLSMDGTLTTRDVLAVPALPSNADGNFFLAGEATGFGSDYGAADGSLTLTGEAAFGTLTDGGFLLTGEAGEGPLLTAYGFLVEQPAQVVGYGDLWFETLSSTFCGADNSSNLPTAVILELLAVAEGRQAVYEGTLRLSDAIALGSPLAYVIFMVLEDTVILADTPDATATAFARAVSRLLVDGVATHFAEAVATLAEALAFIAVAEAIQVGDAVDSVVLGELLITEYQAYVRLIESVLFGDDMAASHTAFVIVHERLLAGVDLTHEADLMALVRDAVAFSFQLSFDNGEFIAWVLNTESRGLTTYTNYPFNSFARLGGRYLGAAGGSLYWLDGPDDAGDAINARLRLGMTDFGTRVQKRLPEAFLTFSSAGDMLVRVIVVDEETQEKSAATYRAKTRGATVPRETRAKFGRGLKTVDWDIELENVDGQDFDLKSLQFRPLFLDRRTKG